MLLSIAGWLLPVGAAGAEDFSVDLVAPPELKSLLEGNLQAAVESKDPKLSATRFEFLARRAPDEVRDLLATEGYFSPRVEHSLEVTEGRRLLRVSVDPGMPSRITSVALEFQGDFALQDSDYEERKRTIRRAWPLPDGVVFRDALWVEGKDKLLRVLQRERYPAARIVDSLAEVDPDRHEVNLRVVVDSGPAFRFGALEVSGLDVLPERIVTGLNRIKPGDPYREQDLEDFQSRLLQTGYFTSVFVSAPHAVEGEPRVPIRVSVAENLSRKLGVGVGYSTDKGAGLELRYEDSLTFRPGWRSTSRLKLEQLEQSVSGDLLLLPVAQGFQPVISAEAKRTEIQNDETVTARVIGQLRRSSVNTTTSLSVDLHYEWDRTNGVESSDVTAVPINLSWTKRVLDDLLFPRRGYVVNLQAGGALERAFSNTSFLRLYGRGNYYHPLGARGTLLLRGELGAVEADTREDIPADYLFRAGGSLSVRGYEYGSLGIREGDAIVPGRYVGVASVEWSHPIVPGWLGAVFVDAGNVVDRIDDYEARLGYGAGIRWKSPLGPLNLDVAYGEHEKSWRLHFSVGSLF